MSISPEAAEACEREGKGKPPKRVTAAGHQVGVQLNRLCTLTAFAMEALLLHVQIRVTAAVRRTAALLCQRKKREE